MDLDQKFVPPVYCRLLAELLLKWGVEPDVLLEGSGLTLENLRDPTHLLSLRQEITLNYSSLLGKIWYVLNILFVTI